MRLSFESDVQAQAEYLCFLAKGLHMGLYTDNGFLVLPKPVKNSLKSVVFPDFNFSPKFWQAISSCHHVDLIKPFPKPAVSEAIALVPQNTAYPAPAGIDQDIHNFINKLSKIIPGTKIPTVNSIKILLTPYGTSGSFYPQKCRGYWNIYLTYRFDLDPKIIYQTIFQAYITIITKINAEVGQKPWFVRQGIGDFFFKLHFPSVKINQPFTVKQLADSKAFLKKLNLYSPILKTQEPDQLLSPQEKKLYQILISNSGRVVTYDEISQSLWEDQSYQKFSLFAISKVIEGLRKKTSVSGLPPDLIRTARGRGYFIS